MRKTFYSTFNDIEYFRDTRWNIIDKISFALYHNVLGKISQNLKAFTECHDFTCGKHDICFLGDFCQLKAFGDDLIYKHQNGIYWEGSLNCWGTHQFNNYADMQRIMPDMQDSVLSPEDRNILNSRVINGKDVMKPNRWKPNMPHSTIKTEPNSMLVYSKIIWWHFTKEKRNPKSHRLL